MIPTSSSASTNGCDNISSNCVIWQGPDISCINLCSGDTISEVTAKLGTKVCDIITNGVTANPSLVGLDIDCLNIPGTTPTTLVPVLNDMIVAICANAQSTVDPTPGSELPLMTLPVCLQYTDTNGNPVTQLRLDAFALLVANQVCTNLSSIQTINATLTSYSNRLDVLEACVLPCSGTVAEKQIVPTCIVNVGALTNVSVVVLALESAFCSLRDAVGLPSAINLAIVQSDITGSSNSLTTSSTSYGSITGWNNSAVNLAQSVQNAWVVIDDLYTALAGVQSNCCESGCSSVTFAYSTSTTQNAAGLINGILFDFSGSSIPGTFNNVTGGNKIIVTDTSGVSLTTTFSIVSEQNNGAGLTFSTGSLNTQSALSVRVEFGVTNGVDTCSDVQTNTIGGKVPCAVPIISAITTTGLTVSLANVLGSAATYKIDIINIATNVTEKTTTINNPGATVSHNFTGLTPSTSYNVKVTVTLNSVTNSTCPAVTFQTVSAGSACGLGLDVALILDYTSTMGSEINAIKTGFASLVSTISNQVTGGNNYRIGIVTSDETAGVNQVPTYNTSSAYVALGATQKIVNQGVGNTQFITAWEKFADNNGTSATTQINKLNSGNPTAGVPLGGGNNGPDPTDMALAQVLSGGFLNVFRANVAKYIILITDGLPSGNDDAFTLTDVNQVQAIGNIANIQGVKVFVLGAGVNLFYLPPGGSTSDRVYVWRDLATATGAAWNASASPSVIQSSITAACSPPSP